MSYIFYVDGEEVWSPANRVAELFLGTLGTVARVLDKPTGLTMKPGGGWYEVDRVIYLELVTTMVREFTASGRWEFRMMVGSVLAVSIGFLDRAGVEIEMRNEQERKAVAELRDVAL